MKMRKTLKKTIKNALIFNEKLKIMLLNVFKTYFFNKNNETRPNHQDLEVVLIKTTRSNRFLPPDHGFG